MDGSVNEHYLDHVVATAAEHQVEASEDIVAGNGIKLLAKGARISAAVRERLLEHKLAKPLEDCLQIVDGVTAPSLEPLAEALLDRHGLMRALCDGAKTQPAQPVQQALARLPLTPQLLSLVTVYARRQPDRLAHTTGVAMLALSLARRLLPGEPDRHHMLATAGLVHDIGELYIDLKLLNTDGPLTSEQWKHIVTHPLVGQRVLLKLAGAGPAVAAAVLNHHERLDGFGYPRGMAGDQFPIDGQILAAAEWLMALIESDASPLAHASVAAKLIPGEFNPALLELISATTRGSKELAAARQEGLMPLEQMAPRLHQLVGTMGRFQATREWIDARRNGAGPALRAVLSLGAQRMSRIQASYASTGLDQQSPEQVLHDLRTLPDAQAQLELGALLREFGWRISELEREAMLRAGQLTLPERAVVQELMDRLSGELQPA